MRRLHKGIRPRLIEARKKSGMGPDEIAHAAGITRQALWAIENGKVSPKLDTAMALMAVYNAGLDIFMSDGDTVLETMTTN